MLTFTNIVNDVLRRLREPQTSSVTATEYVKHIAELVNEAKREVEDAWKWSALRKTITITTSNGTSQQVVDISVQETDRDNGRWRLNHVFDTTNDVWLQQRHEKDMKFRIDDGQTGQPLYFYFEERDTNGDPYINFWPIPDAAYSIEVNMVLPQADFATGNETILVPSWPVILGAYAKAIAERGEDAGRSHGEVMATYKNALADAINHDNSNMLGEDIFYVG